MNSDKYKLLKDIKLKEFGFLKCNISDPVYKFCVLNNIDNLGDFIRIYQVKRFEMDRRHNFNYFDGIVDLINYIFFGEKLLMAKNLLNEIEIKKTKVPFDYYVRVKDDYYNTSLRRLGFTQNETKSLLWYVHNCNKEMNVIVAMKSYFDFYKDKELNEEKQIFLKKLKIYSDYYDIYKNEISLLDSVIFYKAERTLEEYKTLYKKLVDIKKKIEEVSCEFEKTISFLPQENENVKQLLKSYKEIDCKED